MVDSHLSYCKMIIQNLKYGLDNTEIVILIYKRLKIDVLYRITFFYFLFNIFIFHFFNMAAQTCELLGGFGILV